jgi:hypothetical protein
MNGIKRADGTIAPHGEVLPASGLKMQSETLEKRIEQDWLQEVTVDDFIQFQQGGVRTPPPLRDPQPKRAVSPREMLALEVNNPDEHIASQARVELKRQEKVQEMYGEPPVDWTAVEMPDIKPQGRQPDNAAQFNQPIPTEQERREAMAASSNNMYSKRTKEHLEATTPMASEPTAEPAVEPPAPPMREAIARPATGRAAGIASGKNAHEYWEAAPDDPKRKRHKLCPGCGTTFRAKTALHQHICDT